MREGQHTKRITVSLTRCIGVNIDGEAALTVNFTRGDRASFELRVTTSAPFGDRSPDSLFAGKTKVFGLDDKTDTYNELQEAVTDALAEWAKPDNAFAPALPTSVAIALAAEFGRWLGETTTPNLNADGILPGGEITV